MAGLRKRKKAERADFLVIGGGIGGLQAAITGSRLGLDVLVLEKADTRRSGCAANGNDHFACYIPECHGRNFDFSVGKCQIPWMGAHGRIWNC